MQSMDLIWTLVSFILTLLIFSYLLGDNPLFRVASYLFVGVTAGYVAVVVIYQVILPKLIWPLMEGNLLEKGLTLIPLVLTRRAQPKTPEAPRLRPRLAWERSPLAAAAVVSAGITTASFRMVGPVYGVEVGLDVNQIAFFLAAFVLGGALSQYPAGWLADRYDRRWVLVWLSAAAILTSAVTILFASAGSTAVLIASGLFGFATFPIYSVATAHAHDFADNSERVELSAALMFLYAVGAIAAPWGVSSLIDAYGPEAMFLLVAGVHAILIVFSLVRMRRRAAVSRTNYVYAPRTSFLIGRLLGKSRER